VFEGPNTKKTRIVLPRIVFSRCCIFVPSKQRTGKVGSYLGCCTMLNNFKLDLFVYRVSYVDSDFKSVALCFIIEVAFSVSVLVKLL
jgi:hypothetical protein